MYKYIIQYIEWKMFAAAARENALILSYRLSIEQFWSGKLFRAFSVFRRKLKLYKV